MKRKLISLGVLLVIAGNVSAQNLIAMDGKEWYIRTRVSGGDENDYINGRYTWISHMWIEGDTIVDAMACKKLYTHTKKMWEDEDETLTVGYCRQEGDRFYKNGELMFDLSLQAGEVSATGHEVINTDSFVTKHGVSLKSLTVVFRQVTDVWIEGIGSLQAGIYANDFPPGEIKELISCSYNGQCLYENPNVSIKELSHKPFTAATPYYDLQGRPVDNPTRGIYIKDGRKVVIGQ